MAGQMTKDIKCSMGIPVKPSYNLKKAFDGPVISNQDPKPGISGKHIKEKLGRQKKLPKEKQHGKTGI